MDIVVQGLGPSYAASPSTVAGSCIRSGGTAVEITPMWEAGTAEGGLVHCVMFNPLLPSMLICMQSL